MHPDRHGLIRVVHGPDVDTRSVHLVAPVERDTSVPRPGLPAVSLCMGDRGGRGRREHQRSERQPPDQNRLECESVFHVPLVSVFRCQPWARRPRIRGRGISRTLSAMSPSAAGSLVRGIPHASVAFLVESDARPGEPPTRLTRVDVGCVPVSLIGHEAVALASAAGMAADARRAHQEKGRPHRWNRPESKLGSRDRT